MSEHNSKRSDAKFCSDQCRNDHHNERRRLLRQANAVMDYLYSMKQARQSTSDKANLALAQKLIETITEATATGDYAMADKRINRLKKDTS